MDWFTSEADARAGDANEIPADLGALWRVDVAPARPERYELVEPWQVTLEPAP